MVDKLFGLVSTYGISLAIAFLLGTQLLPREYKRRGYNPAAADWLILFAMIAGIVGAKIAYVLEYRTYIFEAGVLENFVHWGGTNDLGIPFRFWTHLLNPGGLTFFGGLILAVITSILVLRHYKINVTNGFDAAMPALAMGYVWGRLGCFFSGDGCYGNAAPGDTWLFPPFVWNYPTDTFVPSGGLVYNTPVWESGFSLLLFFLLMRMRHMNLKAGFMTAFFFFWHGFARFTVEFWRHNTADIKFVGWFGIQEPDPTKIGAALNNKDSWHGPMSDLLKKNYEILQTHYWYGLTQAQLIALGMMIFALVWFLKKRMWETPVAVTSESAGSAEDPEEDLEPESPADNSDGPNSKE